MKACVILVTMIAVLLTAQSVCAQLNFVSLGDWGYVNTDQANVATQIGIGAAAVNATFLLALGDNFYLDGVANDTDPQWNTTYANVYNNPSLDIPWYAFLGNHDHHYGRGQGEIDFYLNHRDKRWYLPNFWYTLSMPIPNSKLTLDFIFIDTVIWSGQPCTTCDRSEIGMRIAQSQRDEQIAWFNKTIQASTADWLIVGGHYPVYSGGEHGSTGFLDTELLPFLQMYNVDMYLCGHDHTLQHLQNSANSTQFFVSGNGAWRGSYTPIKQSVFGVVDPGFMTHTIDGDKLVTTAIDHTGKTVYQYTQARIPKTHKKSYAESH